MPITSSELFEIEGELGPLRVDLYRDADAKGAVVICHGFKGFARWGFFPHLARKISAAGLNAIAFDFSGSGIGGDRESTTEEKRFTANSFTAELNALGRGTAYARGERLVDGKVG